MKIKISTDPNVITIQKIPGGFCLAGDLGALAWCIKVTFNTKCNKWDDPVYQNTGTAYRPPTNTNLITTVANMYTLVTCAPNLRIVFVDDVVEKYIASMVRAHGTNWIIERLNQLDPRIFETLQFNTPSLKNKQVKGE